MPHLDFPWIYICDQIPFFVAVFIDSIKAEATKITDSIGFKKM